MTSEDIKINIDRNLDIVEPSTSPFASTNEFGHELVSTADIDESFEEIMIPAFNSQREIMETSEYGPTATSPTSERTSKEMMNAKELVNVPPKKQKIIVNVTVNDGKSRSKALKIAVGILGVESVSLKGDDKSQIEVIGNGVDAVNLVIMLRKNVGYAELVSVAIADGEKKEEKKDDHKPPPYYYQPIMASDIDANTSETMQHIYHTYLERRFVDKKQRDVDKAQRLKYEMQSFITLKESWVIPKVPYRLREVKEKAYEPNAISIGPYHYDKEHLRAMDFFKRSSFANIVERTKLEFNTLVDYMKPFKERALNCYERPIHAYLESDDNFIEMMVFDGCFIVQLIRKMYPLELAILRQHIQNDMRYDLLLLENQLPFFVLIQLDHIIMRNIQGDFKIGQGDFDGFDSSALSFFQVETYGPQIWSGSSTSPSPPKDIKHLLDMVHKCCRPSPQGIQQNQEYKTKEAHGSKRSWKFIRSASELNNAGIDFVGEKVINSLFDVTFTKHTNIIGLKIHNQVLKIPTLCVHDYTERMLRNLMSYEQFSPVGEPTYVSDYVVLMDNLVNTGKDVQLLCTGGVIDNWLGDDEAVAQMFNKLRDSTHSSEDFYYAEIFGKVNKNCKGKWNTYKAKLKKDYFSSPWSVFSFIAAVVLLVATLLQIVYTLISYYNPS